MNHSCIHTGHPTVFKIKTSKEYRKRQKAYCGLYNIVNTTERANLSARQGHSVTAPVLKHFCRAITISTLQ